MAKSTGLTIEQVQAIIDDEDLDRDELAEVMQECFGATIPSDLKGTALAEFIYKVYQGKAQEIATTRKESKQKRAPKKKRGTSAESAPAEGNVSRAAFVVGIIQQQKTTTRKELEAALDEAFLYTEAGKSPRTRVNRVLRNLSEEGKIEIEGGQVKWLD